MLGQRAYDHVRELSTMGLISRRRDGSTRRLMTTRRFAEYFGAQRRPTVQSWFRQQAEEAGMTGTELAESLGHDTKIMDYKKLTRRSKSGPQTFQRGNYRRRGYSFPAGLLLTRLARSHHPRPRSCCHVCRCSTLYGPFECQLSQGP